MEKRDTISDRNRTRSLLPPETEAHHESGYERDRLLGGTSRIEFARTQLLLRRYLPAPPARVVDVGGGAGAYAAWLARDGYEVRLLDAVPLHVAQAREAAARQPDHGFSAEVGDARSLPFPHEWADAVLLLGPVATAASVHLAATLPNFLILEYVENEPHRSLVQRSGPRVERGYIDVPTAPGLGIELDAEVIAAHPYEARGYPGVFDADGAVADV